MFSRPKQLFLTLAIFAACSTKTHAQIYTVTDLGAISNPGGSIGVGVNDSGQVTGFTTVSTVSDPVTGVPQHGFFWTPTTNIMIDLGTLGGNSIGHAINANSVIAGNYNDYSSSDASVEADAHPCYWPSGALNAHPLNSLVDFIAPTLHPIDPLNTTADVHNVYS